MNRLALSDRIAFLCLLGPGLLGLGIASVTGAAWAASLIRVSWQLSVVLLLQLGLGLGLGTLAGLKRGAAASALARTIEASGALPTLWTAALIVTAAGPRSALALAVLVGLLRGVEFARLLCTELLRVDSQRFILAAKALGLGTGRLMRAHYLPHAWPPLAASMGMSVVYLVGLDGLLGVLSWTPPAYPSLLETVGPIAGFCLLSTWLVATAHLARRLPQAISPHETPPSPLPDR